MHGYGKKQYKQRVSQDEWTKIMAIIITYNFMTADPGGHSLPGTTVSNPAGNMNVCLL